MGFRRKTRPGRLARLDRLMAQLEPDLVAVEGRFAGLPVVDLGIGAQPWTTLELAEAFPELEVVGVDIGADLVASASVFARPGLRFEVGSFDLPVPRARWVRVMNVCRDLGPDQVPDAHARVGARVAEGGVVVEGSCGPHGEVGVVHWLRRRGPGLAREALVFWLDGTRGDAPLLFRDRLPRDLRGAVGHPVLDLLSRWMEVYRGMGGTDRLARAAEQLQEPGLRLIDAQVAVWAPPGGVPERP